MMQPVKNALAFAFGRAITVLWGGLVACGFYWILITAGPSLEGRLDPVSINYTLSGYRAEPGGGYSFVPRYFKRRDCTYFGVSWFARDSEGNLARVQISALDDAGTAPLSRPIGWQVGRRQLLHPSPGSDVIFAVQQHDCGYPWQTRTTVGPFKVSDGTPTEP